MGGLDDRSPYFIMLNNAKLKETLSQKVTANIAEPIHTPTNFTAEPAGSEPMLPSLSVVLTFSLSLDEAASQMTRIQEMVRILGLQPAVQQQLTPLQLKSTQTAPKPDSLQPTTAARQSSAKHTASPAMMTDKQKRMIFALIARKNLSPESVSDILEREFGHSDGTKLTKVHASQFIDRLMSSK